MKPYERHKQNIKLCVRSRKRRGEVQVQQTYSAKSSVYIFNMSQCKPICYRAGLGHVGGHTFYLYLILRDLSTLIK